MSNRQRATMSAVWRAPVHLSAPPRQAAPSLPILRNLILVNRPGWQAESDWRVIARHVRDFDPRIEVFVVDGTRRNSYTRRLASKRPTLVCSPSPIPAFLPARGKVYCGRVIPKLDQLRRLAAAGVPVPRTAVLTPDLVLDPAVWGEFVIIKPTDLASSSHGAGIQLMRTRRVRFRSPQDYPSGHPGRLGPMVVQQFVNTGKVVALFRVLTLFGVPLYCVNSHGVAPRVDLDAPDEEIEASPIATQTLADRHQEFAATDMVLAVARRADAAMPDVPLKGVDVIRDETTGAHYVLEVNPGGNTWHFSSSINAERRAALGGDYERQRIRQFDAFRTAARVLAQKTIAEAE